MSTSTNHDDRQATPAWTRPVTRGALLGAPVGMAVATYALGPVGIGIGALVGAPGGALLAVGVFLVFGSKRP